MRLELNLPALERLLGGDTEIELHLRQQVVEQFLKRHLRQFVNDKTFREICDKMEAELRKEIQASVMNYTKQWWTESVKPDGLVPTMADYVRKKAQAAVDEAISARLQEYKQNFLARDAKHVEEVMRRELDKNIEQMVQAEVQRRLTAAKEMK